MRKEYDFSTDDVIKNPYAKMLKRQITMNISNLAIDYFKEESKRTSIPYQTLINLYLTDCAIKQRKLDIDWK